MRLCKTCSVSDKETEFKLNRRECERCRGIKRRHVYTQNKEEYLIRNNLWKRANSEKHQTNLLNSRFKHRYGITVDQYNEMLKAQSGKCKICKRVESRKTSARLCVDHDHKTGQVRGLLCFGCNAGLGKFNDDPALIQRAIKYLEAYK